MQIMQVTKNMMANMPTIPAASLQWLHVSISWHILGMPGFKLNLTQKNAIMFSNLLWALYQSYKGSQLIHVSPMHTHTHYIEKHTFATESQVAGPSLKVVKKEPASPRNRLRTPESVSGNGFIYRKSRGEFLVLKGFVCMPILHAGKGKSQHVTQLRSQRD